MSSSVIGALRVNLGLDSAQFSSGLKKAQTGLSSFGKVAAVGFAAVATAAAAAGAAMAVMGKRAVDGADQMSKTAQKVGVTTESLSRLKYAADFAGVGFDGLSTGLRNVGKNIVEVGNGAKGGAATAFQALGISVRDASGEIKSSDIVLSEVAERFARMENGSTKTALALQLFGKSGADLIPMLNEGADGLKRFADESDRTGNTISTKTGRAAERLNDTFGNISKTLQGVVNRVMEAALPAMQRFADTLASPQFAKAAEALSIALVSAFDAVVQAIVATTEAIQGFFDWLEGKSGKAAPLLNSMLAGDKLNLADRLKMFSDNPQSGRELYAGMDTSSDGSLKVAKPAQAPLINLPNFGGMGGGSDALAARLDALRQSLMSEEQLELDSHAKRLAEIQKFYEQGAILKGEHDSLIEGAQQQHSERMLALAEQQAAEEARIRDLALGGVASLFGSLGRLAEQAGEKNLGIAKTFGVAEAVVNTAKGITAAFALPPPASWAQAAAVAASGAAQIATIMSASKGTSSAPSVNGGGGAAVSAPQPTARSMSVSIIGDTFSAKTVGSLIQRLNDELGVDGLEIVPSYKQA